MAYSTHLKLFRFTFVIVQQVDCKSPPLRGTGMKVSILDVQVPRGDSLRAQPVEEGYVGPAGNAQVRVLQRLFLLGRFRDHLDALRVEDANVLAVAIEHLYGEHEVLPLVRIGDEECLGRTVLLVVVQVQRLAVLVRVADSDVRAQLHALP